MDTHTSHMLNGYVLHCGGGIWKAIVLVRRMVSISYKAFSVKMIDIALVTGNGSPKNGIFQRVYSTKHVKYLDVQIM